MQKDKKDDEDRTHAYVEGGWVGCGAVSQLAMFLMINHCTIPPLY